MLRMSVPGERSARDQGEPVVKGGGAAALAELGIGLTVEHAVRVGGSRAKGEAVVLDGVRDTDVVEVTLDGGVKLYVRADEAPTVLGAPLGRGAGEPGTVEVAPVLPVGPGTRGLGDWAIEGLRIIGVDLAGETAASVAAQVDQRMVPAPGLRRWSLDGLVPIDAPLPPGEAPWLLFLHGTFSNTLGSFGALAAQAEPWRRLTKAYGDRILALDHRTLTRSPIDNALEALSLLPDQVKLHLVGYSRGGLVGELLSRGHLLAHGDAGLVAREDAFDAVDLDLFADAGRTTQRRALEQLGAELARLRPTVSRYVRVGCPARGTILASGRLDRWLNLVLNALGLGVGAVASPLAGEIYDLVQAFLLAVVRERSDPGSIPGLEAMIPGAPLVKLLNRPGIVADGDLAVVKGDIEGAGILGRLKVLASDLFYREDHDLVVNTSAMDGGMARRPPARSFFDQGAEVSHFRYFANPTTAARVVDGLLRADGESGGFEALVPEAPRGVAAPPAARGAERRPVAFVLPGITGSILHAKGRPIWVDIPQLAVGGLRRLAIDAPQVTAHEPLSLYYGDLCDFLRRTHEVRPWGYDWRRSILDNAKELAVELGRTLASTDQPVRIVAHSMGGLVARAAFLDAQLWRGFCARAGSRLVQLGTPNGGSWSIPYLLMGRNQLMGYLATVDFTMSRRDQQAVIARFPGVLQMLPHDAALFDPAPWQAWSRFDPGDEDWVAPLADDLTAAAQFRTAYAKAPRDPERLLYVAGQAETVVGVDQDANAPAGQRLRFRVTTEGDGQVPWATGIPAGIRAWYTDAAHGDLPRHEPAFAAILDLLESGATTRLPATPPAARGRAAPPLKVRDPVPMFPEAEDILLAGMGAQPRPPRLERLPRIKITVVHGHLAFAAHPVMVGHYAGDTINGAERQLDQALRGRLGQRKQFGLYPGALGTNVVALDRDTRPRGAIVVGLGDHAELAPGTLAEALRRGLLAYAVEEADDLRVLGPRPEGQRLGVTALLVGSGAGGLPIASCVEALLRAAVEAQRLLGKDGLRELELMELAESRAIRAWREVSRALAGAEFRGLFDLDDSVEVRSGGRRNVSGDEDRSWWQPIQITMDKVGDERVMRYVTTAGRARAEASLVPGNTGFVERFVAQAIGEGARGPKPVPPGRALFELLWPARIKETSLEDRNLRLVVDDATAAFPWELLDDRRPWLDASADGRGEAPKPAAVRSGLVRQLVQTQFREKVIAPSGVKRALVVGDPRAEPQPGFASLPGAEEEALRVAERLTRGGYEVTALIGQDVSPERVVAALFEQAWSIVHIAAHGAVDHEVVGKDGQRRKETGVVLGGGLFLGPAILDQLPVTPALFFVNCCHLGRIDPAAEAVLRSQSAERPKLAASVAVQLVRLGVRGVVAAGWAVDDASAWRFAETLYDRLLAGRTFGMAVLDARRAIYREDRADTTWGAYQCYGEPDWQLVEDVAGNGKADESGWCSLAEAVAAAEEIREAAQVGLDRDAAGLRRQLDRLSEARRRNRFLDKPELRVALAQAYGELGSFPKAIRHYEAAIAAQRGMVPLQALEQLANLKVRRVVRELGEAPSKEKLAVAAKAVNEAVASLDGLIALAGPTIERHNLRGGAYKRLATVLKGKERGAALDRMRACYAEAEALARQLGEAPFYPQLMVLTVEILQQHTDGAESTPARADALKGIVATQRARAAPDDFWAGVAIGDARLLAAIGDGSITPAEEDEIVAAYLEPWRRGGSRLKLSSVTEQLEFLKGVLADGPRAGAATRAALIASLERIRGRIARPS